MSRPPISVAQEDPAPLLPVRRIWDARRQCWVESMTVCRDPRGMFSRKDGTEPDSQLTLTFRTDGPGEQPDAA